VELNTLTSHNSDWQTRIYRADGDVTPACDGNDAIWSRKLSVAANVVVAVTTSGCETKIRRFWRLNQIIFHTNKDTLWGRSTRNTDPSGERLKEVNIGYHACENHFNSFWVFCKCVNTSQWMRYIYGFIHEKPHNIV